MSGTFLIRNSNPVVAGHQVHGLKILPGLSYIDLIYQFFRRGGHAFAELQLRNLAIHQPMVLPGDEDVLVEIQATQIRPGAWQVFVEGTRQRAGRPVAETARHAVGEMHRCEVSFPESDNQSTPPVLHQRLLTEDIYSAFRERGLVHNGFMQVHGLGFSTLTHAFADVGLGEEALAGNTMYMFHPALLDGSVTCASGILPGSESEGDAGTPGLYIPLSYDSFCATSLIRKRCIARIDNESLRRRKDLFLISVDFLDDAGNKIAELKNLALKALRRSDAIAQGTTSRHSDTFVSVAAAPQAAVVAAPASADIKTFLRDFIADAIARRLSLPPGQIDSAVGYYELGLDSVGLLQLVQLLQSKLAISLSPTLLFEYTTIDELVDHLLERYGEQLARLMGQTESVRESATTLSAAPTGQDEAAAPSASAAQPESRHEGIAIIGMAGRFAQARNIRELWKNLQQGRDCISEIPPQRWDWHVFDGLKSAAGHPVSRWGGFVADADCFDARFFRVTPRAAEIIDPQERLFLEASWEAIEDAGYTPKTLAQPRGAYKRRDVGVFAGVMHKDYLLWQAQRLFSGQIQSLSMSNAAIANRVSYFCNFHGPSIVIDTLCSSSLTAVHMATESLRHGECEVALAGGVNLSLHPGKYLSFALLGMHSSDGRCRTFGEGGDGYVAADGVGTVVLKPLARAVADNDHIYAVIKATTANHVGTVSGISVPSQVAQADLIARCLANAGIEPRSISYVEAHGTGTALGDPIEIEGLSKAFRAGTDAVNYCAIGSIKSNIGHAESAAGIAGLIKLALQLRHATLVPSLHGDHPNPHIDWSRTPFVVQTRMEPWQRPRVSRNGEEIVYPRCGAVSSFGAAGSNAHAVLEEYWERTTVAAIDAYSNRAAVVPLSAQTQAQLRTYVQRLLEHIEEFQDETQGDLHRIAYTLQVGREAHAARVAFVVENIRDLRQLLGAFLRNEGLQNGKCFLGDRKQSSEAAAQGGNEEGAREFVQQCLAEGAFGKLAQRWAQGVAIDWNGLYEAGTPRRMSLPTYPFAKERYWIEDISGAGAAADSGMRKALLHPLLHENTSDLDEQRFSSRFSGEEFYLRDHVVKGARVLPGVVFLEMAQAALKRAASGAQAERFCLRNLVWAQPVVVGAEPAAVHVALRRGPAGEIEYEIYSRGSDNARIVHFQGAAATLTAEASNIDLAALRAQCHSDMPVEDCYRLLDSSGLSYGSAFRSMQRISTGTSASGEPFVLAQLSLPGLVTDGAASFELHPSIVDGALQSSIGLLLTPSAVASPVSPEELQPYLPYALESLEVLAPCYGESYAIVRNAEGNSRRLRKLDVTICDVAGNVCARMHGFSARLLEKPVTPAGQTSVAQAAAEQKPLLTFTEEWIDQPLAERTSTLGNSSGALICLLSDDKHRETLRELAAVSVPNLEPVFLSMPSIRSTDPASYALALGSIGKECGAPAAIVVLWSTEQPSRIADYRPLVAFLQGVNAASLPKLRIVLAAVCRTPIERAYVDSWIALVPSLKRLLPHQLQIAGIVANEATSADPDAATRDVITKVLAELRDPACCSVFYEEGQRRARQLLPTQRTSLSSRLRQGATYMITGGLGGLGLRIAERLASKYRANLLLLSRSAPDAAALDKIRALQSRGGRVSHVRADVCDPQALQGAIKSAQSELGPIAGVFHVAGVTASEGIFDAPYADFERVLAPKVMGTLALEAAFAGTQLDFICYFSSSAAVLGDFGACAYAAANRFQMAFARHVGAAGQTRLAINWPLWCEGGMRVGDEAATDLYLQSSGQRALATEEALDLLEQMLVEAHPQQLVLAGEPGPLHRMLSAAGVPVVGKVQFAAEPIAAANITPAPSNDALAPRMLRHLSALLGEAVKMPPERVDPEQPLDEYGFDSILAMQMTHELEKSFGSLSKTLFFEHRDLASLNRYLLRAHRPAVALLFGVEESAAAAPMVASPVASKPAVAPRSQPQATAGEIAIVGLSGRFPQARDLAELWHNLRAGTDCVTQIPVQRWDYRDHFDARKGTFGKSYCQWGGFLDGIDEFDPLFFNMTPVEAQFTDPQQRLFLETVWNLLETNGYTREALQEQYHGKVGVYVGSMYNQYGAAGGDVGTAAVSTSPQGGIANRVSYFYGLQGPSIAIDTMCSSAFVAMHMACGDLRQGVCQLAIAGGVNLSIHPKKYITLSQAQMLGSQTRARSFGEGDGYLPAEGVGAVLLKPLQRAIADADDILAVIKGLAVNHGGRGNGYSMPNPSAQAQVIGAALQQAGTTPDSIHYVEAAANGSLLGDAIEMTALHQVFATVPKHSCPIAAVKSSIGHAEAASGMAQLAKVLLQLRHGELVPSIHADPPNPNISFVDSPFRLQRQLSPWRSEGARRALINSFGAGGTNASLVIEEYLPPIEAPVAAEPGGRHVIVLSAKSFDRLQALARNLSEYVAAQTSISMGDLAYTLQCGREVMASRIALVVTSREELLLGLDAHLTGQSGPAAARVGTFVGGPAESASFSSFTSGSAGEALLATFLRERDLEKLALFWANGGKVPWASLYPRRGRMLPLPGYPFAKQRYWLPAAAAARNHRSVLPRSVATSDASGRAAVPVVHPLLHVNSSDFSECRFSSTFTGEEPYAVRDSVRGLRLIPPAIYFEMLRAAIEQLTGRPDRARDAEVIRFMDVRLQRPVEIANEAVTIHVGLRATDIDRIGCEIYSLSAETRISYCRATAVLSAAPTELVSTDLQTLRERCSNVIPTTQWYEMLMRLGLEYGPAYRDTGAVRTGADEHGTAFFLAELHLPAEPEAEVLGLPPLLLNTGLQAAALQIVNVGGALSSQASAQVPTALSCRELVIFAAWSPTVTIHVHHAPADDGPAVDIDIYDEAGVLLARFQGVRDLADASQDQASHFEIGKGPLLALAHRDIVAPRNELETTLQGFWQEALGFSAVGVFDSFLDVGGNSLSAARVVARINEQYQVQIAVPALLIPEGTIAHLSAVVVTELAKQVAAESAG